LKNENLMLILRRRIENLWAKYHEELLEGKNDVKEVLFTLILLLSKSSESYQKIIRNDENWGFY
jgi:hypothetical protein